MITILIVDDHEIVRKGLRDILERESEFTVVGTASTGLEAIKLARRYQPNVILLDLNLPDITGLEVTKRLTQRFPAINVIIVSGCSHDLISSRLLQAGAAGYVLKEDDPENLIQAIKAVNKGVAYLSPIITQKLTLHNQSQAQTTPFDALSNQELELVLLFIRGIKTKEIGTLLSLSPKTISSYHQKILQKLGVKTDVEMTFLALKHGLLSLVEK